MRSSMIIGTCTLALLILSTCDHRGTRDDQPAPVSEVADSSNGADEMASSDPAPGAVAAIDIPDAERRPVMQAQVVLERLGFGPGVINGATGLSLANALKGFQEAHDLTRSGKLDDATRQALSRWNNIPATRVVTIPRSWGDTRFVPLPKHARDQAAMTQLGYETMAEKLAERFHTTPEVLAQLNPGGRPAGASRVPSSASRSAPVPAAPSSEGEVIPAFSAGQQLRVPNVGADRITPSDIDNKLWLETLRSLGVGTDQPKVAKIVVDKSESWLKAYDAAGKLVATYTVSSGSRHDPLPLGTWGINGVAHNPPFAYDPDLFWDVPDSAESHRLPPGPNGPVGVVWIDLTKKHYGIHGTPAPETIGRAQSHGSVRLANWDAARLAEMVSGSTKVVFQE